MKLEAEGRRAIVDPQRDDIQSALIRLSLPDCKFLILSRSGATYLQVAIVGSNQLVLEYRDGSAERHFRSRRDDFSSGEVAEILEAYRRGEDSWRKENEWRRIDALIRPDPWDRLSLLLAIAGLILMFDSASGLRRGGRDPMFGMPAMNVFSIACVAMMVSAVIDLRQFRTMAARRKVRAIGALGVGVLVLTIQVIERISPR